MHHTKDPGCGVYPVEFDSLVGKELLFKVDKDAQRGSRYGDPFRVKKICSDFNIIQKFKNDDSITTLAESKTVKENAEKSSASAKFGINSASTECGVNMVENVSETMKENVENLLLQLSLELILF